MSKIEIPSDGSSSFVITDRHGTTRYINEFGELHRNGDLPAVIDSNYILYYRSGLMHRDNGPALINSHQEVYFNFGVKHREGDLPAAIHFIKHQDGSKEILSQEYYKDGHLHREHGPAMMWSAGSYQHYKNGQLHNEHGPACHYVEHGTVRDEYYLEGKQVSKISHKISSIRDNLLSSNAKPKFK